MKNSVFQTRKKAFTLVEVMIAMMIFAMAIAGSFACFGSGALLLENARHNTRACQIMQSEIERVHALPWAYVELLETEKVNLDLLGFDDDSNYHQIYTLEREIEKRGSDDYRIVTLTIKWNDFKISFDTISARRAVNTRYIMLNIF